MLIRALIVLLVVLNLGVAAWWLTRTDPPPPSPPEIPAGVAILELVDGPQASTARAAAVPTAAPPAQATPAATASAASMPAGALAGAPSSVCFRVGPFADRAAAEQSRGTFAPMIGRAALRETPGTGASGYRVSLPPSATREEAVAMAQRIGAAGFDDFLVINQGEETNGIALGRYRNRDGAQRRQSQLVAAGFPARIHPIGEEGPSRWWLDVAAPAGTRAATLRDSVAVPVESQDCPAALR